MKALYILPLLVLSACTMPKQTQELTHMQKSLAIESILEKMELLYYDESYSEIDRDLQRMHYANAFHHEVSTLASLLKKNAQTLPNRKPLQQEEKQAYQRIITLLDNNLHYLKEVINRKEISQILPAIKSTKQSCVQCHLQFKSTL